MTRSLVSVLVPGKLALGIIMVCLRKSLNFFKTLFALKKYLMHWFPTVVFLIVKYLIEKNGKI